MRQLVGSLRRGWTHALRVGNVRKKLRVSRWRNTRGVHDADKETHRSILSYFPVMDNGYFFLCVTVLNRNLPYFTSA